MNPKNQMVRPIVASSTDRRIQALALRREGMTYAKIGKCMGITPQTAHELVIKAFNEARTVYFENIEGVRTLELERLDMLLRKMLKRLDDPKNTTPERTVQSIINIGERRAKLLGLDAPTQVGITNNTPAPIQGDLDLKSLTTEELIKLREVYDSAENRKLLMAEVQPVQIVIEGENTQAVPQNPEIIGSEVATKSHIPAHLEPLHATKVGSDA